MDGKDGWKEKRKMKRKEKLGGRKRGKEGKKKRGKRKEEVWRKGNENINGGKKENEVSRVEGR